MMRRQRISTGLAACVLAFASCGTEASPEAANVEQTGATSTEAPLATELSATQPPPATSPDRSVITTSPTVDGDSTTSVPDDTTTSSTDDATETTVDEEVLRLAPASTSSSAHLRWDREGISDLGHAGPLATVTVANLSAVSALPLGLPVFQTRDDERVIWQLTEVGPDELLMVPESEALTLEGAGLDGDGEPIILYQHHVYGTPETTSSTLRSFRPGDGEINEIARTGGWESGVTFSHLVPRGAASDVAVALWSAEGWVWFETLDIQSGQTLFSSEDVVTDECFSGISDCPDYHHAVIHDGDVLGVRPVPPDGTAPVTTVGLWRFDPANGTEELLDSWPWDNGLWYVEDMFVSQGSNLVLSLEDGDGNPLPALHYDVASGESWTEPDAAFLRPAFLS